MAPRRSNYLVAVADAGRGRIFELVRQAGRAGEMVPQLREAATLTNSERRVHGGELFSESRPGLRRGVRDGAGHGVDDRRDDHIAESERQFASRLLDALAERVAEGSTRVVVAASPNMLGLLRPGFGRLQRAGAKLADLPKDLTGLSPAELHQRLAADGLLPG